MKEQPSKPVENKTPKVMDNAKFQALVKKLSALAQESAQKSR
jgi:hypothetical protein